MSRVLLIEPNYKNKYIPANLMKLAWHFRFVRGDDVRFFKGDLKRFGAQLLLEKFFATDCDDVPLLFKPPEDKSEPAKLFGRHAETLLDFIRTGKKNFLDAVPNLRGNFFCEDFLRELHERYKPKTSRPSTQSASTRCSRFTLTRPSRQSTPRKNFCPATGKFLSEV